jgi:hypothetical protein
MGRWVNFGGVDCGSVRGYEIRMEKSKKMTFSRVVLDEVGLDIEIGGSLIV